MHIIFNGSNISNSLYTTKIYKKDQVLFEDGLECFHIGLIEYGSIQVTTQTIFEQIYEINNLSDDDLFGSFLLYSPYPYYLGTGIATKTTKVIYFTKENFLKALKDENFLINYLQITSSISQKTLTKVKVLSQKTIKDKIMFLLLENYKKTKSKKLTLKSKLVLANYLNIPRPSLSRELITLKKEGYIDYNLKEIILIKLIP